MTKKLEAPKSQDRFSDRIRRAVATSGMNVHQLAIEAKIDDALLHRFMEDTEAGMSTRTLDRLFRVEAFRESAGF